MARRSQLLSRFAYGTIYFILFIILLGLILITPGDIIEHSVDHGQYFNIWILTVAYVVTTLVVCFVYALRLYIIKTALAAIPRGWVPVEKSDVGGRVHKMVACGLNRSAAVAHAARPRVRGRDRLSLRRHNDGHGDDGDDGMRAAWGVIEHPGWSSPDSPDLPNLQYATVLCEVPSLVEAKALTLSAAPALQRPAHMGLREYLARLAEAGVVGGGGVAAQFLARYEDARFSTRPMSDASFRELMHLFAELLRAMRRPLGMEEEEEEEEEEEDDIDDDAPNSPRSRLSVSSAQSAHSMRLRERSSYRTAPDTPGKRPVKPAAPRRSGSSDESTSSASVRSKSDASGSILRLATREDDGELPYVLSLRDTGGSEY